MKNSNKYYKVEELEEGHVRVTYFPEKKNPTVEEFQVFHGTVRLITEDMAYKQPVVFRRLEFHGNCPLSASKETLFGVIKSEAKAWCLGYRQNNPTELED